MTREILFNCLSIRCISTSFGIVLCFCLRKGVFTQPYFNQHLFLERERRSYFFFCNWGLKTLLEEGVFTQPYSISYSFFFFLHDEATVGTETIAWRGGFYTALFHLLQYCRVNFLSIRCFCLKEGFFTQPYFISAHLLVSYKASVWRGGFYTALFHLLPYYIMRTERGKRKHRVDFLSIRCFCLKEGFFTQPYFILAHLWYHTMLLLEEGVFIQPYSISYSVTLWLKRMDNP